jgi:hypothetical protein
MKALHYSYSRLLAHSPHRALGKPKRSVASLLVLRAQVNNAAYYVGIDFGTSGARICAVDGACVRLQLLVVSFREALYVPTATNLKISTIPLYINITV